MEISRVTRSFIVGLVAAAAFDVLTPYALQAEEAHSVQTAAFIRVVAESSHVTRRRGQGDVMVTVPQGTILETLTKEDQYYWVLLDRDDYGTRRAGFIAVRDIEPLSAEESAALLRGTHSQPKAAPGPSARASQESASVPTQFAANAAPARAPAPEVPRPAAATIRAGAPPTEICEVLVHFEFAKSDLQDEAKRQIEQALAELKGDMTGVSFHIEGHADAIGTEPYNERLGQARAESVKQYLVQQHHVAVDQMMVVSHGESQPMAPNSTKAGRALNRRVIIKILG